MYITYFLDYFKKLHLNSKVIQKKYLLLSLKGNKHIYKVIKIVYNENSRN